MSWRRFFAYLVGTSRRSLLTLPLEIQCMILRRLPFKDLVTTATVCRHLRELALCECRLWTELPQARLENVEQLLPFIHRAGKLGTVLGIDDIEQYRLNYLVDVLYSAVPALRSLRLQFALEDSLNSDAMGQVLHAIAKSAPLLEHLELRCDHFDPVDLLPTLPDFDMPHPRLVSLALTAYKLEVPPRAFSSVRDVETSVIALCPRPQLRFPTGTPPQWANATLHTQFPAVRKLKLIGIQPGTTDGSACALRRLPYINQPLHQLELLFESAMEDSDDPETVRWVTEGTHNVERLAVHHFDCFGVRDATLRALAGAPRLGLRVWSLGDGYFEISGVIASRRRERTVRFEDDHLRAHLTTILTLPLTHLTELWLHAQSWIVDVLPLLAGQRHLETLGLVYQDSPPFPAIPTGSAALGSVKSLRYGSHTHVEVDATDIVTFTIAVVPRITSVVLSHSVSLNHPHALPPTIRLGRM